MKKILVMLWLVSGVAIAGAKFKSIEKVVTTAGTRVALSSSKLMAHPVIIQACSTNGGLVYVGGVDVAAANGYALAASAQVILGDMANGGANELVNLADVYVDAAANGYCVRVLYAYDRYKP